MAGPRLGLARWLLFLLDLLPLLFVALLEVLRLLLVALLEVLRLLLVALLCLLPPGVICILLNQTLMFLFLFLLEFLMFLFLFGVELVLLLLVLLIELGVARVWRSKPLVMGEFAGMRWTGRIGRAIGIRFPIGGRLVAPSCFPGSNDGAVSKCARPGSGRDGRFAVVYGGAQLPVGTRCLNMLVLRRHGRDMSCAGRGLFFGAGSPVDASATAVIADAIYGRVVVDDRRVVGVMDFRDIYIVHRAVIEKSVVVPTAAFITAAEIAVAVTYASVETDDRTPIALMEDKGISAPAPIAGRPEKTWLRSQHPGPWNPIVVISIPSPVTRSPDIAVTRADGLLVHRQERRSKSYRNPNADLPERCSGNQ